MSDIDLTFHKLTRSDVYKQLNTLVEMFSKDGGSGSADVVVARINGEKHYVYKIDNVNNTVNIRTTYKSMLDMAPFFGSNVKAMTLKDVVDALGEANGETVLIDGSSSVGKVLGMGSGCTKSFVAVMFPVPENIEAVNEWVSNYVVNICPRAKAGQKCGTCDQLVNIKNRCEYLEEADRKAREHFSEKDKSDE